MLNLRVMTLNLGGGVKNFTGEPEQASTKGLRILQLVREAKPDLLCVQEIAQHVDGDGIRHSMVDMIRQGAGFSNAFYGETLSMKKHMQVKKGLMVNGLFNDWWDWSKGNAVFSRLAFARLGDENKEGVPRNVPIFQPLSYEGSRDTDPRYIILSRLKQAPYPYIVNLHLTTMVGERGPNAWKDVIDAAHSTRAMQISAIMGLVERHVLEPELPMILLGDFNTTPESYVLRDMLEKERGFVHLEPENPIATHPTAGMVDHIYYYPAKRLLKYQCRVLDSELSHQVSDHLPVLADLSIE